MGRFWQQLAFFAYAILIWDAAASAAPAIKLSPIAGHPEIPMTASGTGFSASEAVDVYFDTIDEFLAVTDDNGQFAARTLSVPKAALPGTHWITAVGRKNGDAVQRSFLVRTDWPQYGFEPQSRGRNPYENMIDAFNVGTLDIAWSMDTGPFSNSSPVHSSGWTYFAEPDGYLVALAPTRAVIWQKITCTSLYSSPTTARGNVYVGCLNDYKVSAFKATTGALVWSQATDDVVASSPVIVGNTVYIGGHGGKVYALNATTGAMIWSRSTGSTIDLSTPAVANGKLYFGGVDGYLNALDAGTGTILWNVFAGGSIDSSPAVANGAVYFGSFDHNVYALNAKTGATLWTHTTGDTVVSSPAVLNNTVFIGSNDGNIYALNADSGTLKWNTPLSGTIGSSAMSLANGVGYIGTSGGSLYALDLKTGTVLWSANVPVAGRPAIADGIVYAASSGGGLYAFAIDAGFNPKYNSKRPRPPYASLHPDFRLKPK